MTYKFDIIVFDSAEPDNESVVTILESDNSFSSNEIKNALLTALLMYRVISYTYNQESDDGAECIETYEIRQIINRLINKKREYWIPLNIWERLKRL